jgi:valyl-tRNA synthetase
MAAQGRDIKLSTGRIEGYRNFVTKLWNAARYAQMSDCRPEADFDPASCALTVNRWIVDELVATERKLTLALEEYRFNDAANAIYQFTWHTFCDWYLEFTKPILGGGNVSAQSETRAATAWVLEQLLHLLHPIMPFVTEELWEQLAAPDTPRDSALIGADWPDYANIPAHQDAVKEMDWIVELILAVRAVRAEMNVSAAAKIPLLVKDADKYAEWLRTHYDLIIRLARLSGIDEAGDTVPKGAIQVVLDEATLLLPLGDVIDIDQERARLSGEIKKLDGEITRIDKKLANEKFVSRAPAEVVEENREKRAEYQQSRSKLSEAMERLAAM